jgi:hypothetical protein
MHSMMAYTVDRRKKYVVLIKPFLLHPGSIVTLVNYKKENLLQYYDKSATLHVAVFFISGKNSITFEKKKKPNIKLDCAVSLLSLRMEDK